MRPLLFPLARLVPSLALGGCGDPPGGGDPAVDDDAAAGDDDSSPGDDDVADDDAADDDSGPGDDDTSPGDDAALLALAGEVDEAEIAATIQALQDLGTRHSVTAGDEAAREWIHDRLADLGGEVGGSPPGSRPLEALRRGARDRPPSP